VVVTIAGDEPADVTPETATLTLQPGRAGMAAVPAVPPVHLSATPHSDRGLVPRPRLVRRLSEVEVPIAVITAPAGYGKTTLLADWAARDPRPFARLPDAVGKEPQALREAIASALSGGERSVLVIDDADRVVAPGAIRELADVALGLAPGSTVALASRSRLALPIGRLRAHRLAVEVGRRELAMTRLEAAMLLDAAGLRLDGDQVDRLLERTEGWPAALYLAATALREEADPDAAPPASTAPIASSPTTCAPTSSHGSLPRRSASSAARRSCPC
jgi:LuxR family transcriptional regulator, maltose regulon positive regulatory protein